LTYNSSILICNFRLFNENSPTTKNIWFNGLTSNKETTNIPNKINKFDKNIITFGLHSVLRLLKKGKLCPVLVSTDLKPHFIVKQLILLGFTQNRNIKFLCVPELDNMLEKFIPFNCKIIGIAEQTAGTYKTINNWINEESKMFSIPEHLINLHKNNTTEITQNDEKNTKVLVDDCDNEKITDCHLSRQAHQRRRVFLPSNVQIKKKIIKNDFLSFNDSPDNMEIDEAKDSDEEKIQHEKKKELLRETLQNLIIPKTDKKIPKQQFISLQVKKIQGNIHKVKKKNKKGKK